MLEFTSTRTEKRCLVGTENRFLSTKGTLKIGTCVLFRANVDNGFFLLLRLAFLSHVEEKILNLEQVKWIKFLINLEP